jgi:hypothetical protein
MIPSTLPYFLELIVVYIYIDAPVEILRIQANVLAKTSLFLISDSNGVPDSDTISTLFAGMSEQLLNPTR